MSDNKYERQPTNINEDSLQVIIDRFAESFPKRTMAFLLSDGSIVFSGDFFEYLTIDYVNDKLIKFNIYKENIECVLFSDTIYKKQASICEMMIQKELDIPFGIISVGQDKELVDCFFWGSDNVPDLLNRSFRFGTMDCFALIRDAYMLWNSIKLDEVPRDNQITYKGKKYSDTMTDIGLVEIERKDIKPGDIICGSIGNKGATNHGALYLGNNKILHHLAGRKSEIINIGRWKRILKRCFRHEDFLTKDFIIPETIK